MIRLAIVFFVFSANASINFDSAINIMTSKDPEVQKLKSKLDYLHIEKKSKLLNFAPDLELGHTTSKDLDKSLESHSQYVKSTINIFGFGADSASLNASKYSLKSGEYEYLNTLLESKNKSALIILDYIKTVKSIDVLNEQLEIKSKSYKNAKLRYNAGRISKHEVFKFEVDLENFKSRLDDYKIKFESVTSKIISEVGSSDINALWPFKSILAKTKVSEISSKLPLLKQLEMNYRSNQEHLKAAKRSMFPSIDLSLRHDRDQFNGSITNSQTAYIGITIKLFDRFNEYARVKKNAFDVSSSKYLYASYKREVDAQITSSFKTLETVIKTMNRRDKTLGLSKKLYLASEKAFKKGKINVNDLLQDQGRYLDSRLQLIEGVFQAHKQYLNFCKLRGRFIGECQ